MSWEAGKSVPQAPPPWVIHRLRGNALDGEGDPPHTPGKGACTASFRFFAASWMDVAARIPLQGRRRLQPPLWL